MAEKYQAPKAPLKQRTNTRLEDFRGDKNNNRIEVSETCQPTASTSKEGKENKLQKPLLKLKEDSTRYNTTGNSNTLLGSGHELAFRSKDKTVETGGSSRGYDPLLGEGGCEDACIPHSVLLIIDLNSRNPTVAFIAPSLGYSKHEFLPVLKAMSKTREALLTSTKHSVSGPLPCQSSTDWVTEFLSHCRALLRSEIGMPLEDTILELTFTARGDASDRSKAMLLMAVKAAGFKIDMEDAIQIFPSIEAVTIETVRHHVVKRFSNQSSYSGRAPKAGHNVLVLHHDGDVAEIQSYSVSFGATTGKAAQNEFRLEEISDGETVDYGKLVDNHFARWMDKCYGVSVSYGTANSIGTNVGLMDKFAKLRREYVPGQKDPYIFSLTTNEVLQTPQRQVSEVRIQDSEMRNFFELATDSLLRSLDDHHARVGQRKKTIDEVIFAGAPCISPYVENVLKDWGIGFGLLDTNIQAFPVTLGRYIRVEASPEMIVRGAIHGSYPGVELVPRCRAHYGFKLASKFEDGDPDWSRKEDLWDNIDKCNIRMSWQVHKDQLLDAHATVTENANQILLTDSELSSRVELYRCELDNPPRWVQTYQNRSNPDMHFVGAVNATFTEADILEAEHKLCDDGLHRRRFNFKVRVLCGHFTRTLRVRVTSEDGRRELGSATFQYQWIAF